MLLGRSWAIEVAQEQVDRDTSISRIPTVAPGSLPANATSRGSEGSGAPSSCWALQRHASMHAVRGPCEDAEATDTWHGLGWRDEAVSNAAVPNASNRHDGASLHCRSTAPTLRFPHWNLTLQRRPPPLKGASSMPSALHLPLPVLL
jgi:hypothetical protein